MKRLENTIKTLGLGIVVVAVAAGCASAKKGPGPAPTPAAKTSTYTVVKGDCLWCISGKKEIYGNPYQWPIIYKSNSGQIKDADLIYPGQSLTIDRAASAASIEAAIKHAKTRGAWQIGVVEESDKKYLAANK